MVNFIYVFLFVLMLLALYVSGKQISFKKNKLFGAASLGIIVFTLNEGLRFGRGIDYNYYAADYQRLQITEESTWDPLFLGIAKLFGNIGIPWQGYVLLMSFVLIVSCVVFLDNFRDICKWAFPLFAIFAFPAENLMRWFFAFSFIMIGLSLLLKENSKKNIFKYILWSAAAFFTHFAILPVPIVFWLVTKIKKPILKPIPAIILFFAVAALFQVSFMERFVNIVQIISLNERAETYQNRAEYWLTGGFAGGERSALPPYYELLLLLVTTYFGYTLTKNNGQNYTIVYNLFLIGFLTFPICRQIELLTRYNNVFTIFQFIVLAYIIEYLIHEIKWLNASKKKLLVVLSALIIINFIRVKLFTPFYDTPDHFLYVWDSAGRDYLDPHVFWLNDMK